MSDSQPVAATIQQIKAAYPKAKSDFIVRCLEQGMPLPQVAGAAMEEVVAENSDLSARLDAVIAELTALKASTEAEVVVETPTEMAARAMEEEIVAMEKEEETAKARVAARGGVKPIAKAKAIAGASAKAQWSNAIDVKVAGGMTRGNAIMALESQSPGLRNAMLAEANSKR